MRYNRTNDELHPVLYRGLTIWLVTSVWILFNRGTYEGLTLSVITPFFLILVGIEVAFDQLNFLEGGTGRLFN